MIHSLVQQWMWRSLGCSLEAQRSHHLQYLLIHQVLLHMMCWRNPLCLEDILITEFLEMVKIEQNMKDWFYTMPTRSSRRRPPSAWVPSIIIVAHPRCVQPWIHFHWLFEWWFQPRVVRRCKTTSSCWRRCSQAAARSQVLRRREWFYMSHSFRVPAFCQGTGWQTFEHFLQLELERLAYQGGSWR